MASELAFEQGTKSCILRTLSLSQPISGRIPAACYSMGHERVLVNEQEIMTYSRVQ